MLALPPFVPVKYEEVNFDVSGLNFAHQLFLTFAIGLYGLRIG